MTFIARLLRYLFWIVIVSWTVSLLRRIVRQMNAGQTPRSDPYMDVPNNAVNQKLVRDPVCGMHIAEGLALPLKQGNETVFFCSAECRDKYVKEHGKFAANG